MARIRPGLMMTAPAVLWTLAFFAVPLCFMLAMSLWTRTETGIDHGLTLANYAAFFNRAAYIQGLVNSLEIGAIVTVLSILLAYPFAWILAFHVPARWQRLALLAAILPFWTSYVVRSYAWLLVLSRNGVLSQATGWLGLGPLDIASSRIATVIGFVHFFTMLLTLTIFANLKQLPPNYARAAQDLGASRVQTFRHIILPLTLPGIMVGGFLTFVLTLGDYITPQILGGNNELVLPQVIMLQISRRADFPSAAALSLILMAVITLAYLCVARWLKVERL